MNRDNYDDDDGVADDYYDDGNDKIQSSIDLHDFPWMI